MFELNMHLYNDIILILYTDTTLLSNPKKFQCLGSDLLLDWLLFVKHPVANISRVYCKLPP